MRRLLLLALATLLAVAPAVADASAQPEAATPQEARLRPPVYGSQIHGDQFRNFPDPSIVKVGNRFYAYGTSQVGANPRNIMVMSSPNLWDWDAPALVAVEAMPRTPAWARSLTNGGEFWAPSVVRAAGRYVMYFAGRHKNVSSTRPGWCIGIATSDTPVGPFVPRSTPFFCQVNSTSATPASFSGTPARDRGAIDPQVFRAPNGNLFLYFKALNNLYQLWGVRLSANGLSRSGPGYGLVPIDAHANTWEYSTRLHFTVLENPNMVYNNAPNVARRYLLTYSGGEWQIPSNYGTGYAACTSPLAGCVRLTTQRPWLYSRGDALGPGGASTFTGPDGKPWIAYHTYQRGHTGIGDPVGRRLHVEPLRFGGVTPHLNNRRPTGTITASPGPAAGQVQFQGTADDPDTGRYVRLSLREGGQEFVQVTAGPDGNWSYNYTGQIAGDHTYCAVAFDDNGLSAKSLGCRAVTLT
jgi:hypothetical protein